ncbi:hypothetical protein [Clostridium polynesiense]|uniref:hypothetical protein n=1 Tax=Clostridium polynesiense TaxID=1325933 RepID=UPI00058BDFBC|nr:hypothetical protein [Clostridium polynesiense]
MDVDIYRVFEGDVLDNETPIHINEEVYSPAAGRMLTLRAAAFFNASSSVGIVYLKLGSTYIINAEVQPLTSILLDCQSAILLSGEKIYLKGGIDSNIKHRIWGVEMDY